MYLRKQVLQLQQLDCNVTAIGKSPQQLWWHVGQTSFSTRQESGESREFRLKLRLCYAQLFCGNFLITRKQSLSGTHDLVDS